MNKRRKIGLAIFIVFVLILIAVALLLYFYYPRTPTVLIGNDTPFTLLSVDLSINNPNNLDLTTEYSYPSNLFDTSRDSVLQVLHLGSTIGSIDFSQLEFPKGENTTQTVVSELDIVNSNQIGDFVDDITDGNIILEISGTLNGDYKISSTKASINQFQTINVNPNVTFATYEVRNNSKSVALSSSATSVNMTFTVDMAIDNPRAQNLTVDINWSVIYQGTTLRNYVNKLTYLRRAMMTQTFNVTIASDDPAVVSSFQTDAQDGYVTVELKGPVLMSNYYGQQYGGPIDQYQVIRVQ